MRAMPHRLQVLPEEQLPKRHEDFLATKPRGLEDLPRLCWPIEGSSLDHRRHSPAEWLWWMHQVLHEVNNSSAEHLEDIRWLRLVASQHAFWRTQW